MMIDLKLTNRKFRSLVEEKFTTAKEIIDIYYKYNFTDWYDFTTFGKKMLYIANKVTNIPVAE